LSKNSVMSTGHHAIFNYIAFEYTKRSSLSSGKCQLFCPEDDSACEMT